MIRPGEDGGRARGFEETPTTLILRGWCDVQIRLRIMRNQDHLYGGMDEPETKIIDVFICKLRRKLNNAGANGFIATAWGQGYVVRNHADGVRIPDAPIADHGFSQVVKNLADHIERDHAW
jgi:hypothetical protein